MPEFDLFHRFVNTRGVTMQLAEGLSDADATVQSMPDASPAKWHLGHTTWFFETFVLRDHAPGYELYRLDWPFLFNSYYEVEGARLLRSRRGMLSRPSLEEVREYRRQVDQEILTRSGDLTGHATGFIELGIHHEQ